MMRRNKIVVLVIAVCMACSMIACGRSNHSGSHTKPSGNTNASNNEVVTQESAAELMSEALDASVVPEEELTPSGSLTNAILEMTEVVILDEKEDYCEVRITYPDVKTAFVERISEIPNGADETTINTFYSNLTQMVLEKEVEMIEVTLEVPMETAENGRRYIVWTKEAQNALTGGLYDLFYEKVTEETR